MYLLSYLPPPLIQPSLQHDMSFSPHNCQLALQHDSPLHSFFSLARHATAGMVLTYHVLTSSEVCACVLTTYATLSTCYHQKFFCLYTCTCTCTVSDNKYLLIATEPLCIICNGTHAYVYIYVYLLDVAWQHIFRGLLLAKGWMWLTEIWTFELLGKHPTQ